MANELIKTGEVYYIDEEGRLCYAVSYEDKDGTVITEVKYEEVKIEE